MNVLKYPGATEAQPESSAVPEGTAQNKERMRNGIFLLSCPRSASIMFQTMLAKQSKFRHSGYFLFVICFTASYDPTANTVCGIEGGHLATLPHLPEGKWSNLPEDLRTQLLGMYQKGYDGMMEELQRAKNEGKEALIKEHAVVLYGPDALFKVAHGDDGTPPFVVHSNDNLNAKHTNPTCVPDEALLNMQPIFLIRHPGLMFPSMARAETDIGLANGPMDIRVDMFSRIWYSRRLYEWYLAAPGALAPKIISADDVMYRPDVVRKLCDEVGLDFENMQYEWEMGEAPPGQEDFARFASTLYASQRVVPGYGSEGFDLGVMSGKWRKEFGEDAGDFLARRVEEAMPDYEWLMERRVKVYRSVLRAMDFSHPSGTRLV